MHWICDKFVVAPAAHTHSTQNKWHCRCIGKRSLSHRSHNSRTMRYNDRLRVFLNGAWITWIYIFAVFSRLGCADAKIGEFLVFY